MLIKRRDILKAIRTERLKGKTFITPRKFLCEDGLYVDIEDDKCKVCAVGAVLRTVGINDTDIDVTGYEVCRVRYNDYYPEFSEDGDEFEAIKEKSWMVALSVKFEKLFNKYGAGKKTKGILARFVKRHFPKQFRVEI